MGRKIAFMRILSIPVLRKLEALLLYGDIISLDAPIEQEGDGQIIDFLWDKTAPAQYDQVEAGFIRDQVEEALHQ